MLWAVWVALQFFFLGRGHPPPASQTAVQYMKEFKKLVKEVPCSEGIVLPHVLVSNFVTHYALEKKRKNEETLSFEAPSLQGPTHKTYPLPTTHMPTHRHQPRPHSIRLYHSSLEIQKLLNTMKDTAELIRLIQLLPTLSSTTKKNLTLLLLLNMASAAVLTHIPRMSDDTALPRRDATDFHEIQFKEHFRFRKQDFYRLLCALKLTVSPNDPTPQILHIGNSGTRSAVSSDWAMMVLLKRLSAVCQYRCVC